MAGEWACFWLLAPVGSDAVPRPCRDDSTELSNWGAHPRYSPRAPRPRPRGGPGRQPRLAPWAENLVLSYIMEGESPTWRTASSAFRMSTRQPDTSNPWRSRRPTFTEGWDTPFEPDLGRPSHSRSPSWRTSVTRARTRPPRRSSPCEAASEEPLGDNYLCEVPTIAARHTSGQAHPHPARGQLHRKGAGGLLPRLH